MTAEKEERFAAFLALAAGDWDERSFTQWLTKSTCKG